MFNIGDAVRIKISRDVLEAGDVGYIAHIDPDLLYAYAVVKDEKLAGVGLANLGYDDYDYFQFMELEKLHSHEEVKAQLGLVNNEKHYTKLMLENKSIYLDKNKKYGDAFAETIQKYGYISALTRMNDKFNRIEEFTLKGFEDEEESLRDSLMDLANYCYMYVMEIEKEKDSEH